MNSWPPIQSQRPWRQLLASVKCGLLTSLLVTSLAYAQPRSSENAPQNQVEFAQISNPDLASSQTDPESLRLYQSAFKALKSGDVQSAIRTKSLISDPLLMPYLEFQILFSPNYTASYNELLQWLELNGDHPYAMRAWSLAKRKKPADSADPPFPTLPDTALALKADSGLSQGADGPDQTISPLAPPPERDTLHLKSARSAYNNGDLEAALELAKKVHDPWVEGLAAWRLGRYDLAESAFSALATDPTQSAWSQSGGAYWAGRAALRRSRPEEAKRYFTLAATYPFTFYGLVAEARLGVTPAVVRAKKGLPPLLESTDRDLLSQGLRGDLNRINNRPEVKKIKALRTVGQISDAEAELRIALRRKKSPEDHADFMALASTLDLNISPLKSVDKRFDLSQYPLPDFLIDYDSKLSKELLLAIARKESKFNPKAKSYAGAYGLLQIMPATAATIMNDPNLSREPVKLLDAKTNLLVGQTYLNKLLDLKPVKGDLFRMVGAYNAGPRPIYEVEKSLGSDSDALLVMESIPVAQTRQYIEEVIAAYWVYRHLQGLKSPTLIASANDAPIVSAKADWAP